MVQRYGKIIKLLQCCKLKKGMVNFFKKYFLLFFCIIAVIASYFKHYLLFPCAILKEISIIAMNKKLVVVKRKIINLTH